MRAALRRANRTFVRRAEPPPPRHFQLPALPDGAELSPTPRPARRPGRAAGLLHWLWPQRSAVSGRSLEASGRAAGVLLPEEFAALAFRGKQGCEVCAGPLPSGNAGAEAAAGAVCPTCAAAPPPWARARAALAYDDASRPLVLAMKHGARRAGVSAMGRWMAQGAGDLLGAADLLVPVPVHRRRLAARTFNQAAWLAEAVSRASGTAWSPSALQRPRATRSQGGLSAGQRARNVAGAFRARRALVAEKACVLVDDVYTTGATLRACARELKRAGAERVDVLVLARVVRDRSDPT